jgi:hypothetical protein
VTTHHRLNNRESFSHSINCFADPQRRNEYFRLYSDDIILQGYQGIEPGLESVKKFYCSFWKLLPDAQVLIQDLIGEGDILVARYLARGLHGCSCGRTTDRTSVLGLAGSIESDRSAGRSCIAMTLCGTSQRERLRKPSRSDEVGALCSAWRPSDTIHRSFGRGVGRRRTAVFPASPSSQLRHFAGRGRDCSK